MKTQVQKRLGALVVGMVAMFGAVNAQAVALISYTAAVGSATTELTEATTAGLGLFGIVFGIGLGIKLFKRIANKG